MHGGDQAAARALWQEHAGRLTALARSLTGSHADALDAVQEAFVAVLALSRTDVSAVQDEAAYLAQAVHARSLNLLRASARRAAHEREGRSPPLTPAPAGDPALERALDVLPLNAREVLALKHLAGLTFEQMAFALEAPRATVSSRYYAALALLRGVLQASDIPREVTRA